MRLSLFLHFIFLGVWLGCVLIEGLLEVLASRHLDLKKPIARICFSIDQYVEIPTFIGVLVTGAILFDRSRLSPVYNAKIIFGLLAILVNILCVIPVKLRRNAALAGDEKQIDRRTRQILYSFAGGIPPALIALFLGLHLMGIV